MRFSIILYVEGLSVYMKECINNVYVCEKIYISINVYDRAYCEIYVRKDVSKWSYYYINMLYMPFFMHTKKEEKIELIIFSKYFPFDI